MPQESKRDAASILHVRKYVHLVKRTLIGTCLVCCFVQGLSRCAVLCCARGSTTTYILVHTTAVVLLVLYVPVDHKKGPQKNEKEDCCRCINLANSVCLLVLSDMYDIKSTAKCGTAKCGNARHSMAGHDTARCYAAPLS